MRQVLKTEEKGSDVNLATELLNDCFQNKFDNAIIVSNDSDLIAPIKLIRESFGKRVTILNPHKDSPSTLLQQNADKRYTIEARYLKKSQFDLTLSDEKGAFYKPPQW